MSRSTQIRREPVNDPKYIVPFGRYKGEAIEDILEYDPGWLVWAHNNTDFELSDELLDRAETGNRPASGWERRVREIGG